MFMCEKDGPKQKFLLSMYSGPVFKNCCLFADACTFVEDPCCVRHKARGPDGQTVMGNCEPGRAMHLAFFAGV